METEQTPGDSEGQGSLARCSTQGHREADVPQQVKKQQGAFTAKTIYTPPCAFLPQLSACFLNYPEQEGES